MDVRLTDHPVVLFVCSVVVLWLAALGGSILRRRLDEAARADYGIVLGASLTLLSLLVGFSFTLSVSRYNERKSTEAREANAIGTEYLRLQLLPSASADDGRRLLRAYTDLRIHWYEERNADALGQNDSDTDRTQNQLWAVVRDAARAKPSPTTSLAASGMNDVINAQGYTLAAWIYRVPRAAWWLMFAIAVCANAIFGFSGHVPIRNHPLFVLLPLMVSIAFMLIADIDAPRTGLIHVAPQNLELIAQSMR